MLESGGARIGSMILEWERKRQLKKFSKDLNRLRPEIEEHEAEKSDMSANTDTPPDYERYKQEFSLLRRIQHRALLIRRYLSLLLYTITWLSIWFLGALIFRSTEVPQSWSYFDAMYFAYTSILTIGYGDFYPTSNSGKAFFVLWALIAVPMLTILVGSMSDAVIRFVNDGRRCGGLGAGFKAIPPGLLGESQRFEGDSHDPRLRSRRDGDLECGGEKDFCESKSRGTSCGNATAKFDARREVRADIQQYHCLLAEEMVKVMKDANSTLPRKYSFEEWAWFLKLIGEGRGDSLNGSQRERNAGPCDWMGSGWLVAGSGQAEAEWILKGLMRTLQRELREAARRGQA